jgi:hypothetical protein
MWHLGDVGHVTYSFKIMLLISTRMFDDKLCANVPLKGVLLLN